MKKKMSKRKKLNCEGSSQIRGPHKVQIFTKLRCRYQEVMQIYIADVLNKKDL